MAAVGAAVFVGAAGAAAVSTGVEVVGSVGDTAVAAGALPVAGTEVVMPVADIAAQAAMALGPGAVTPIARQVQVHIGRAVKQVQAVADFPPVSLTSTTVRPRLPMVNGIRSVVILAAGHPLRAAGRAQIAASRRLVPANPHSPMGNGVRSAGIERAARQWAGGLIRDWEAGMGSEGVFEGVHLASTGLVAGAGITDSDGAGA